MLKTRIIPCLDVNNGRVVKGINFVNLVDAGDPVEQAMIYDAAGADELCFLDITASHENRSTMVEIVAKTAPRPIIIAFPIPPAVPERLRLTDNIPALAFGIIKPQPKPTNKHKPKNT